MWSCGHPHWFSRFELLCDQKNRHPQRDLNHIKSGLKLNCTPMAFHNQRIMYRCEVWRVFFTKIQKVCVCRSCLCPGTYASTAAHWTVALTLRGFCKHRSKIGPLKGVDSAERALQGSDTKRRELLGETKENSILPNKGSLICPPGKSMIPCKKKQQNKNWVSCQTWIRFCRDDIFHFLLVLSHGFHGGGGKLQMVTSSLGLLEQSLGTNKALISWQKRTSFKRNAKNLLPGSFHCCYFFANLTNHRGAPKTKSYLGNTLLIWTPNAYNSNHSLLNHQFTRLNSKFHSSFGGNF